jgi:hypothetical protein
MTASTGTSHLLGATRAAGRMGARDVAVLPAPTRRTGCGKEGRVGGSVSAGPASGVPSFLQNFAPGTFSVPQVGQATLPSASSDATLVEPAKRKPSVLQNVAPGALTVPHCGQTTLPAACSAGRAGCSSLGGSCLVLAAAARAVSRCACAVVAVDCAPSNRNPSTRQNFAAIPFSAPHCKTYRGDCTG